METGQASEMLCSDHFFLYAGAISWRNFGEGRVWATDGCVKSSSHSGPFFPPICNWSRIHFVHTKEPKWTRISLAYALNRNISSRLLCLWMVLIRVFSSRCDQEGIVITMSWTTVGSGFYFREKPNRFSPSLSPDWLWNSHIPLQNGYLGLWAGRGERRGLYRVLVGKPEGKRPLERLRRRWEDNIEIDLQEVGFGGVDWIDLAQDRDGWRELVNAIMNFRVP